MTDDLWCWQVLEAGEWGLIGARLPNGDAVSALVTRSRPAAEAVRPLALTHQRTTGLPVRLARFQLGEVLEHWVQ